MITITLILTISIILAVTVAGVLINSIINLLIKGIKWINVRYVINQDIRKNYFFQLLKNI